MLKKTLDIIINLIPLKLFDIFLGHKIIGIEYHLCSNKKLAHIVHLFKYKTNDELETDLLWLKRRYKIISLQDYINGNSKKNNKKKILTFDDGYKELLINVLPILEKHDIPAVFFITTDFTLKNKTFYRNIISLIIDKINSLDDKSQNFFFKTINDLNYFSENVDKKTFSTITKRIKQGEFEIIEKLTKLLNIKPKSYFLNKQQIIELHNHPLITIGAHSLDHRDFAYCTEEEIKHQITESVEEIKKVTKSEIVPFAFPFSSESVNRSLLEKIQSENSNIYPFFGECSFKSNDEIVLKRFQGERFVYPYHVKTTIKEEYKYHLKDLMKKNLS